MRRLFALIAMTSFITLSGMKNIYSCTLWGAAGESASSKGTLIIKNRDWAPDHTQKLKIVTPKSGHRYFGLFAEGNNDSGIKAGINDKELAIISASASSIPRKVRKTQTDVSGIISKILSTYGSVDELLADKQMLSHGRAGFFIISDKIKIAVIEIGLEGTFAIKIRKSGTVSHTNHFLESSMLDQNQKIGKSSISRFDRISRLMSESNPPFTVDMFKKFSDDRLNGPDNSIWRTGSTSKSEKTLATWLVENPHAGSPVLYVRLANPGEEQKEFTFIIDEKFWRTDMNRLN
jgi:isopenicillin-N N-acyltransferase like protein